MTPLSRLISIDRRSGTPVYLQIANSLISNILKGQVPGGARLPGTSTMAKALGANRKTLQAAYDELMAQGWIEILPRRGAFIVRELPDIRPVRTPLRAGMAGYPRETSYPIPSRRRVEFPTVAPGKPRSLVLDGGLPDTRLAPITELVREYRSLSRRSTFTRYLGYGHPRGSQYLLEALADFLRDSRGLVVSPENILVTRGAQMAFYLVTQLLVKPGDHVVVGDPGYALADILFREAGAIVDRVPVDESGIRTDDIESLCRRRTPRFVYVIPHHHVPTTVTLSPDRRLRLLDLAVRHGFAILEDDYDYDFEYDSNPFLPMASIDSRGSVIYVGTLTKSFAPTLRLGFLVAPGTFVQAASDLRRSIDLQGDSMMEAAVAELYRNGTMRRHMRRQVKVYRERRDNFCALLRIRLGDKVSFTVPSGGLAIWASFPGADLARAAKIACEKGLTMSTQMPISTGRHLGSSTRLGFASLDPGEQEKAVGILAESLALAKTRRPD